MLASLIAAAIAFSTPPANVTAQAESVCDIIGADLPSTCTCTPQAAGGTLDCKVTVPLVSDSVEVIATLSPCATPASMAAEVKESAKSIDFKTSAKLPQTAEIPIPDLNYPLPAVGTVGANLAVKLAGSLSALGVSLGFDVCLGSSTCGTDLPIPFGNPFPLWLLQGTYDFTSVCSKVD